MATIQRAIEKSGGDRRVAAERLGIGLSTLYRKLGEEE
jgi:two-component system response regulator AtoC